jgi:hypothetical protein
MQKQLDLVWDKLLPAFGPEALPANPVEQEKLRQAAARLVAHPTTK